MSIKIPVSADFDGKSIDAQLQQLQQKLNAFGQQIAQANKVQFSPVSKTTVDDLRKITQQFEALKRVSGDLNRRVNATGQKGVGFFDLDWARMYPQEASRNRHMARAFEYVTGRTMAAPPPGPAPRNQPGGPGWTQVGVGAVQAGLRGANGATGGTSGVAANALGTGMSAGFGAGMMGLLGGMLALGVGKLVGAVTEKIDQAEQNNVLYDTLKRQIGDVNVSFNGLKTTVQAAADNLNITFDEAGKLGQQFAKLGNLTADRYSSLREEIETGTGFSRGFGLDPSQGVGFLGTMRGARLTKDENDSRRLALLIGEAVGKSDAFAKADEVMDAIAGYATSQTRSSMSGANVAGYAGMYSAMVGSGLSGFDPAGAASMLARMNSSLSGGGAKGEASQFFTSMVGNRMGLDPFQMQILREGGMFATNDQMFGGGSAYARYMGKSGPKGGKTYLQGTMDVLKERYSDPMLRAQAFANHAGVNMNQAMAFMGLKPNEMGELQKYLGSDLQNLNASGIANAAKVISGTGAERESVRQGLLNRKDLKTEHKEALEGLTSKSVEEQKKILAGITAQYEQEQTQGKDIRDSKNALDNIKTSLADKLVPYMLQMRMGILYLAGDRKKTQTEVMKDIMDLESKDKINSINSKYNPQIGKLQSDLGQRGVELGRLRLEDQALSRRTEPPEVREARKKALREKEEAFDRDMNELNRLRDARDKEIDAERARHKSMVDSVSTMPDANSAAARTGISKEAAAAFMADAKTAGVTPEVARLGLSIYSQESSGGRNTGTTNHGATGHMQMKPSTFAAYADPGWDINNPSHNRMAALRYLADLHKKSGGNVRTTAGAYYGGEKAINSDGSLKLFRDLKNPNNPNTHEYADSVVRRMNRMSEGTPMPADAQAVRGGNDGRLRVDDLNITIRNERGQPVAPPQQVAFRVSRPTPFGERYS